MAASRMRSSSLMHLAFSRTAGPAVKASSRRVSPGVRVPTVMRVRSTAATSSPDALFVAQESSRRGLGTQSRWTKGVAPACTDLAGKTSRPRGNSPRPVDREARRHHREDHLVGHAVPTALYELFGPYLDPGDILGHVPMGIVEETGPDVHVIAPGDRVVIPFNISCRDCFMCNQGLHSQCETTQVRERGSGASLFG